MFKIDLHTHSLQSPDGSLRITDYQSLLGRGDLHYIAVTDHNTIEYALKVKEKLGDKIIVGEEISAREGEIVGLYLSTAIPAGLSAAETADKIHEQGGLVYIPHPFETVRKGLPLEALEGIASAIDIIEVHNGRAIFQDRSTRTIDWAKLYQLPGAASSDAHGRYGWGKTYSVIKDRPTKENLAEQLYNATCKVGSPGVRGVLYPKVNRLRKKLGITHV